MPESQEAPAQKQRLFCVYCGGNIIRLQGHDLPEERLIFQCTNPKCSAAFSSSRANPIFGLPAEEADAVQKVAAGILSKEERLVLLQLLKKLGKGAEAES